MVIKRFRSADEERSRRHQPKRILQSRLDRQARRSIRIDRSPADFGRDTPAYFIDQFGIRNHATPRRSASIAKYADKGRLAVGLDARRKISRTAKPLSPRPTTAKARSSSSPSARSTAGSHGARFRSYSMHWRNDGGFSNGETSATHEIRKPRVIPDRVPIRVAVEFYQPAGVFLVGFFEPNEGIVAVIHRRIDEGDIKRRNIVSLDPDWSSAITFRASVLLPDLAYTIPSPAFTWVLAPDRANPYRMDSIASAYRPACRAPCRFENRHRKTKDSSLSPFY